MQNGDLRYHLAIGLQTLLIGPAYTFAHWASAAFNPFVLLLIRSGGVAVILSVIFLLHGGFRGRPPSRREWLALAGLAGLGLLFNQFFFLLGMKYTTPASGSLIYSLTPLLVLLLGAWAFRVERLTPHKLAGVLIALLGVLLVFYSQGKSLAWSKLQGNLLLLLAVTAMAGYMIVGRRVLARFTALQGTTLVMTLMALMYAPIGLSQLPQMNFSQVSLQGWTGVASLILINSIASYLLINYALMGLASSRVAIYMNAQPLTAALFSELVMHEEQLSPLFALGGLITLGGIYWLNRARLRADQRALQEA
jgi:drug/metabolite transporter (DMT)-like permease